MPRSRQWGSGEKWSRRRDSHPRRPAWRASRPRRPLETWRLPSPVAPLGNADAGPAHPGRRDRIDRCASALDVDVRLSGTAPIADVSVRPDALRRGHSARNFASPSRIEAGWPGATAAMRTAGPGRKPAARRACKTPDGAISSRSARTRQQAPVPVDRSAGESGEYGVHVAGRFRLRPWL